MFKKNIWANLNAKSHDSRCRTSYGLCRSSYGLCRRWFRKCRSRCNWSVNIMRSRKRPWRSINACKRHRPGSRLSLKVNKCYNFWSGNQTTFFMDSNSCAIDLSGFDSGSIVLISNGTWLVSLESLEVRAFMCDHKNSETWLTIASCTTGATSCRLFLWFILPSPPFFCPSFKVRSDEIVFISLFVDWLVFIASWEWVGRALIMPGMLAEDSQCGRGSRPSHMLCAWSTEAWYNINVTLESCHLSTSLRVTLFG